MEKRYVDQLMSRLDAVYHRGWVEIEWTELYLWYGAQRIGKNVWRDIEHRLAEIFEETSNVMLYCGNGSLLIVKDDMLEPLSGRLE